ncbi:MAG TPA: DMT family transporter [Thermoleophilia bacterium]|nr:DMT family transporter [Thermoleophilia bacterium]
MNPAFWGVVSAFGWGTADFIARSTGRAMGPRTALFGMLSVGAVVLTAIVWIGRLPLSLDPSGYGLLLVSGVGTMLGTLLLYRGLARGPLTVVAPIVGAYPALNVVVNLVRGIHPSPPQWVAMIAVIAGVAVVALAAPQTEGPTESSRRHVRRSALIAVAAAVVFAATMTSFQDAMVIYGELQTVMLARWISLIAVSLLIIGRGDMPRLPAKQAPSLLAQGLLDGGAYLSLLYGSHGEGVGIVVVVSSTFAAVTVFLARILLREAMSLPQWGAIALIVGGVVVLSG